MAALIRKTKKSERGFTTIETVGVLFFVLISLMSCLAVAYVTFATAWIRYQSEQGLYCMSMGGQSFRCEREVRNNLKTFLPPVWTQDLTVILASSGNQKWQSRVIWTTKRLLPLPEKINALWRPFRLYVSRELDVEGIRRDRRELR